MAHVEKVRVRFAPSPTGRLHIGGLRTALFNWLFARHHGGVFLLRVEDTDTERSTQEHMEAIFTSLAWADILPDEPFLLQTHRLDAHREVAQQLLDQGKAYRCFCLPTEIKERQKEYGGPREYMQYDGYCRDRQQGHTDDKPYVVRFAIPRDIQEVSFADLIRGDVSFPVSQLDDFIIVRSDGRPVYNFVVVVDDAFMHITHVIRGDDHIANTPKQILLYQACGYRIPKFAHVPLIVGKDGQPLSKRDVATSVEEYRVMGYLPDALLNYLARLGWSYKDQEIFTRDELIKHFSLEGVGKKSAVFDMVKLDWVNGVYLRALEGDTLVELIKTVRPFFVQELKRWSQEQVVYAISLYKERAHTLVSLSDEVKALYDASTPYVPGAVDKWIGSQTVDHLRAVYDVLSTVDDYESDAINRNIQAITQEYGIKFVNLAQPLRIALTGKDSGPGVVELLALLGQQESITRLEKFIRFVQHRVPDRP